MGIAKAQFRSAIARCAGFGNHIGRGSWGSRPRLYAIVRSADWNQQKALLLASSLNELEFSSMSLPSQSLASGLALGAAPQLIGGLLSFVGFADFCSKALHSSDHERPWQSLINVLVLNPDVALAEWPLLEFVNLYFHTTRVEHPGDFAKILVHAAKSIEQLLMKFSRR